MTELIPQTSLWIISKGFVALLPSEEKGKILLLPSLHVAQSRNIIKAECSLLLINLNFNKWEKILGFWWPRRLCQTSLDTLGAVQKKDKIEEGSKVRGIRSWRENRRPCLGPFAISYPKIWSYTIQSRLEKCMSQLLSTSWPTKSKFIASLGETKTSFKKGGTSPTIMMGRVLPLVVLICEDP